MAQINSQMSVKFGLRIYHYRTHEPQGLMTFGPFRTAKKAANEFADHIALDFNYRYPKTYKQPNVIANPNQIVVEMVSDNPIYAVRHEKAYRRALKIFKALGLK